MLGKITIIGRPNVGKSSFFNMFIGHKIAVVADEAGTTRDISEFEYVDQDTELTYLICDSGWLDFIEYDRFTALDEEIYKTIKTNKDSDFILVANKCDNENKLMESYSLAGKWEEEFFPVSVSHNRGITEVKDYVKKHLKKKWLDYKREEFDDDHIKLAIIGRPNVGKSSIINTIVGKNRVMVKDLAGTTRDSIDTKLTFWKNDFVLIDTAGIRRLSRVGTRNIENWSLMRTDRSMKRADIVAVVVDGFEGIVQQDLSIISKVLEEKKGLERAIEIQAERQKRVKTSIFNEFLEQITYNHAPTGNKKSHSPKIYYGSQVDTNPPKFVVSVSNPNHFHFSYKRYMENKIRDNFWFFGTPITIEFKGRGKHKDKVK